jgi:hypothetical protein
MAKTFLQGHNLTLTVYWQDGAGNLVDVYDPSNPSEVGTRVTITHNDDVVVDAVLMNHPSTGTFTYSITLHQSSWPAGMYEVEYSAVSAEGDPLSVAETFEVLESETYTATEEGSYVLSDLLPALERHLDNGPFTAMSEVMNGVADGANKIFGIPTTPVVYESETIIVNDGGSAEEQVRNSDYSIDYDTGLVTFSSAPNAGAYVTVTYQYKRHSTEELIDFLVSSIQQVSRRAGLNWDVTPGDQGYMLDFDPGPYTDIIFLGARMARELGALSDDAANAIDWSELGTSVRRSRMADARSTAIANLKDKFDQELKSLIYDNRVGGRLESGKVDHANGADYKLESRSDSFVAGW